MDEKRCSTCHLMKSLTEFNRRAIAKDGLQARCRSCSREWYEANREQHKANVAARNLRVRHEWRARITDYLLEHPCVDCGEPDIRVLEFDHDDPTLKLDEVVRLAWSARPWSTVEAEIAKCSVRCSNCHRRRTAEVGGYWPLGRRAETASGADRFHNPPPRARPQREVIPAAARGGCSPGARPSRVDWHR